MELGIFGEETPFSIMTRGLQCNNSTKKMRAWQLIDLRSFLSRTGIRSGKAWTSTGSNSTNTLAPTKRIRTSRPDIKSPSILNSQCKTKWLKHKGLHRLQLTMDLNSLTSTLECLEDLLLVSQVFRALHHLEGKVVLEATCSNSNSRGDNKT